MQRESNVQTLNWADKTMSVLRLQQLEACEKRLSAYLGFGLFSGCDDAHVEELWATSYEAGEQKDHNMLHTVEGLQNRVLAQLPREAALLSVQEHMLVERMLLFDGEAELMDVEEAAAAESLLARMWCYLRQEEDRFILCLPRALWQPLRRELEDRNMTRPGSWFSALTPRFVGYCISVDSCTLGEPAAPAHRCAQR